MVQGRKPSFCFVCQGVVQLLERDGNRGVLLATDREAAKRLLPQLKNQHGKRVAIAEIGTIHGESLAAQLSSSVLHHGANGAFATDDGETFSFFFAPAIRTDDE